MRRALAIGLVLAMTAAACGGTGSGNKAKEDPNSTEKVTINLWTFATGLELKKVAKLVARFHAKYPNISVKVTGAKGADSNNGALKLAATSSRSPDVGMMNGPDDIGQFCAKGLFQDLTPFIERDKVDTSVFTKGTLDYTSSAGKQCSLPLLTDAYGLYYNTKMFADAGISGPPKTISELTDDAKKLTTYNADGSLNVVGFLPLWTFELSPNATSVAFGAKWYDSNGKAAFGSDPGWLATAKWNKALVDFYGYDKLQKWYAKAGGENSEWAPQNVFEVGKVAMQIDGEWRVQFIIDDKSTVPYATAPFPVADSIADQYGIGEVAGTVIGIPKNAPHSEAAWKFVRFVTTDTATVVEYANLFGNVPTTKAAARSPDLKFPPQFQTFLDVYENDGSHYKPLNPLGSTDQDSITEYLSNIQRQKVTDAQITAGLSGVAKNIDNELARTG